MAKTTRLPIINNPSRRLFAPGDATPGAIREQEDQVLLTGHVQHSIVIPVASGGDRDRLELVGDDAEGLDPRKFPNSCAGSP